MASEREPHPWRNAYEKTDRLAEAAHLSEAEIPTPADIPVGVSPNRESIKGRDLAEVRDRLSQMPSTKEIAEDNNFDINYGRLRRTTRGSEHSLTWKQKAVRVGASILALVGVGSVAANKAAQTEAATMSSKAATETTAIAGTIEKSGEQRTQEKVDSMLEESNQVTFKASGDEVGLDQFLDKTQWQGEYDNDTIEDAIRKLNPEVDFNNLQENQPVVVPVKKVE